MPYPRKLRDHLTVDEMKRLYWDEQLTLKQIGAMYNVSWSSVRSYMMDCGIERRDKYSVKWLRSNKKVNEQFFSKWTEEMAYVLGVIVTDGSIEKDTGDLRICMTDKDIIEKMAKAMDLENGISLVKKRANNKQQYKLSICRHSFVSDLIRLGISVDGTKTWKQGKVNVPKEFRSHFVRGCYDGDGSLGIRHRISPKGTPYISHDVTIVSASKDSLEGIVEMLNEDIGIDISVKSYKGGTKGQYNNLFRINFSDRNKIAKFLEYIYKDKDYLYLDRKFQKYITEGSHLINKVTLS